MNPLDKVKPSKYVLKSGRVVQAVPNTKFEGKRTCDFCCFSDNEICSCTVPTYWQEPDLPCCITDAVYFVDITDIILK